ncbi:hypothetical protein LY78DRAFT_142143 [Colletotrichum sublineola]|nr:hypothetical protein LY78DRAFT_142143 [Colletotrichum sublineola]
MSDGCSRSIEFIRPNSCQRDLVTKDLRTMDEDCFQQEIGGRVRRLVWLVWVCITESQGRKHDPTLSTVAWIRRGQSRARRSVPWAPPFRSSGSSGEAGPLPTVAALVPFSTAAAARSCCCSGAESDYWMRQGDRATGTGVRVRVRGHSSERGFPAVEGRRRML